ncbi:hypothetical protein A5791_20240 [Mycobacterium sp. 852002-51163_SCH5372311]|uniref:PPE family protein n=1 Tax=Mycobacterium sp. 852002-51163_SCH5372311 TaxID=1834097 RepID=UPI0008017741|nr:PPE family protein [Mycobacterium sp. 852002-51163_SCH5372311]OBF86749.1 hypothetical protein A5791_20240 [Mycobacterium sp. 852002-51163_SCH5372311]
MDFAGLPPEINSSRMYTGPGAAPMLAASAGWDALAAELHTAAGGYQSVMTRLTGQSWIGPSSMSMAAAVTPYLVWMRATATQCEEAARQATAAAGAFETAYAMTVPPPMVAANRVQLATLVATNLLGQNTPAIMANEAEYAEMWAQDVAAMYGYAASSAAASAVTAFTPPPQTTSPGGVGAQAGAVAHAAGTRAGAVAHTASTHLMSTVPQTLQGLATPGSSTAGTIASSGMSSAASAPVAAVSGLAGVSGMKGVGKSAGALEGAATGLTGLSGEELGLAEDTAGLGMDAFGLVGLDGGGVGLDLIGVGMDFTGADELSESAGLGPLGALGQLGGAGVLGPSGGSGAAASLGQATPLGTLSVPPSWGSQAAQAVPMTAPAPIHTGVVPAGTPSTASGPAISRLPLGGMVGRESEGALRVGFRPSLIPHSPSAG